MVDDNSWVFDSLVCFLHGPVWNAPLQTFIEEKSLIFDPNFQPEEFTAEYIKIHEEYKNLVDFMLGSFMDEMQITPDQFELACLESRNQQQPDNPFSFHQGLFQQIWAANDIKIFNRMMTQRNVELQLQALDLIERQQNSTNPEIDDKKPSTENSEIQEQTEAIVIKEIEQELKILPDNTIEPSTSNLSETGDKFDRLNLFFDNPEISPDDIKSRQEYLQSQRDKILKIKKNARTKQLNDSVVIRNDRPSSAQIAQKLLNGENERLIPISTDESPSSHLRKTLAKRLRLEVVEKP